MIAGTALAAWLADREAQERSYGRVDACAKKWGSHPLMTELERAVSEMRPRTVEGLLDAARRFIDRTGDIDAMLSEFIATSRLDPFFRPPFHPLSNEIMSSLLLYHHPDLSIALGVTGVDMLAAKKAGKRGATSINFTGYVALLRIVKAGGATLSFWEAPPIPREFVAAEAGVCRLTGRRRIADGEEIVIDGRFQSFVIEHAESDMLYFQAVARAEAAPVGTEYDSASRRFIGASSTDEASSRVQMMTTLLRTMGRDDAFPVLEASLECPQFYTRWHVMREMLAMDAEASLPALRRMAEGDPHPDIRAAARQTLELFFAGEAAPAATGEAACRA